MELRIGHNKGAPLQQVKSLVREPIEKDHFIIVELSCEEIKAVSPEKNISEKLQISEKEPILERIRKVYDPGKRPIEYCIGYYRAHKFSYSIDIKREVR